MFAEGQLNFEICSSTSELKSVWKALDSCLLEGASQSGALLSESALFKLKLNPSFRAPLTVPMELKGLEFVSFLLSQVISLFNSVKLSQHQLVG
jgi:hypothetical protein